MTERNTRSQSGLNSPCQVSVRNLQWPRAGLRASSSIIRIRRRVTLMTRDVLFLTSARAVVLNAVAIDIPAHHLPRAAPAAFWIPAVIWRSEVLIASVTAGMPDPGISVPGAPWCPEPP
jgi:hypothetical protein